MCWNDFAIGVGALVASRSTDGGATWSPEVIINNTSTFYRDTQLAVQPANGQVDLRSRLAAVEISHVRTSSSPLRSAVCAALRVAATVPVRIPSGSPIAA